MIQIIPINKHLHDTDLRRVPVGAPGTSIPRCSDSWQIQQAPPTSSPDWSTHKPLLALCQSSDPGRYSEHSFAAWKKIHDKTGFWRSQLIKNEIYKNPCLKTTNTDYLVKISSSSLVYDFISFNTVNEIFLVTFFHIFSHINWFMTIIFLLLVPHMVINY